ncbi:MAG TPA: hypothetical protein VGK73_35790 [Polyangiaceae bacterium]
MKTLISLLLLGLSALACSSADDDFKAGCEPNTLRACACEDGNTGTQTCTTDGAKWGSCTCEGGGAGTGGGGEPVVCTMDDDCRLEIPAVACIDNVCTEPVWVGGGERCSDPATRCSGGYTCDGQYCNHNN